ncbi:hypothetical protein ACFU7Y_00305 [Kitasatospora sp. NPDC057542]|uniref:hypothetical protein n=1 Tax=Streptomycetaceae TaxID=2062 RepID=UPI001CCE7FDF|nr:hypothetical protein [Streptomyces sp. LS1784]
MRTTRLRAFTSLAVAAVAIAALAGCQDKTGSAAPYPCGQSIASADRFADSSADLEKDPEGAAANAGGLARELRAAGERSTDRKVKSALGEFADAYDEFAQQVRSSDPARGKVAGIEKTFTRLEKASARLDDACKG